MLVYRVENAEGLGPYQGSYGRPGFSKSGRMCDAHCDEQHYGPNHPLSGLAGIRSWEYCGLDSAEALLNWFYDFFVDLDAEGFLISVYRAENARVGANGQTLFDRDEAVLVERITYDALFDLI